MTAPWQRALKLHELGRGPVQIDLHAGREDRRLIADQLKLHGLESLSARLVARPWFEGVALEGRFQARVVQICGISLEPFEQLVEGDFEVRVVPSTSPQAPDADGGQVDLDLDAPDPPDVMTGDAIDITAYVVEHLALEVDPFPRQPGATFVYDPPAEDTSPFAALRNLAPPKA